MKLAQQQLALMLIIATVSEIPDAWDKLLTYQLQNVSAITQFGKSRWDKFVNNAGDVLEAMGGLVLWRILMLENFVRRGR